MDVVCLFVFLPHSGFVQQGNQTENLQLAVFRASNILANSNFPLIAALVSEISVANQLKYFYSPLDEASVIFTLFTRHLARSCNYRAKTTGYIFGAFIALFFIALIHVFKSF